MYNIIDSGLNVIITFNGAITRSVPKSSISYGFTNGEKVLQVKGSQNPYDVLASWDISTISSLNNSATLQDGFDYLQSIIDNGVQAILGSLNSFDSEADALSDGLINGNFWFDQTDKLIKRIWNYIQSYTAGRSTIGFTNNGGDDWNIEFKIAPTSLQIPSGEAVDSFDYNIIFASGGTTSVLDSDNKTADYTYNASANGAGVYAITCAYQISNGTLFTCTKLVKVDASGNILASIDINGLQVVSVSGLVMNYVAHVSQVNATETVFIDAIDGSFNFTNIGTGASGSVAIPLGSIGVGIYTSLNATLWADLPSGYLSAPYQLGANNMVTIS